MTLPDERARALRFAGEVLREMQFRMDIPEDLKHQARVALRHYPEPADLLSMVQDVDRIPRGCLDLHWLAPEAKVRIGSD